MTTVSLPKRALASPYSTTAITKNLSSAAAYSDGDPNRVVSKPSISANHSSLHRPPPLSNCHIDTSSEDYCASLARCESQVQELNKQLSQIGGSPAAMARHHARGKLLAKQRLEALVDPGTALLELGALVANDADPSHVETPVGAGLVTAIGIVCGRPCVLVANDATVKGGTYFPLTVQKHLRAQQVALDNALPCIYLVDSGGAYLPLQRHVFPDRLHFGRIFYHQALLSSKGVAQIAVVCGSCTAGGAYVPSMSDETLIVKNNGTIFLGGPPLVQAATGQVVTAEELGGARVHTHVSGVADHYCENEQEALQKTRDVIRNLGQDVHAVATPTHEWEEPLYDPVELRGVLPQDVVKQPVDMKLILARILDGSRFHEFKQHFGKDLLCGFGQIHGQDVGILANQTGILFAESAQKGAHFVELCCQRGIPLLFLQNISGFMVGTAAEHGGIAKHGAKLVTAVATAKVPKLTLIVGGSFGAGNYGMCGRAYDPRFLWMWPSAQIGVMGGEQAAQVLWTVHRQNKQDNDKEVEQERQAFQRPILDRYAQESSAYFSTSNLWDDGIIDPADTRRVLGLSLAIARRQGCEPNQTKFGVFRM